MFASASADKQVLVWHSNLPNATPAPKQEATTGDSCVQTVRPRTAPARTAATPQQQGPQGALRVVQSTDFQPPPSRSVQQPRLPIARIATQPQVSTPAQSPTSAVPNVPEIGAAAAPGALRPQQAAQQQVQQPVQQQVQQPVQQQAGTAMQMDSVGAMLQKMAAQLDVLTRTVVSMDERLSTIEKEKQENKN